jgi:uncharacterized protein
MMQILRAADYRRMPWKNGGGETREILVVPPGAALDSFDWRVSLATVGCDGPFSAFAGVQRTLCVIRGAGIRLHVTDAPPRTLLESSEPFAFDGAASTSASLLDGPIVDLNVMSRQGRFQHRVKRCRFTDTLQVAASAHTTLVFCQRARLQCFFGSRSDHLEPEDCARFDGGSGLLSLHATEPAEVLIIELDRLT